jgi:hypothetical protein
MSVIVSIKMWLRRKELFEKAFGVPYPNNKAQRIAISGIVEESLTASWNAFKDERDMAKGEKIILLAGPFSVILLLCSIACLLEKRADIEHKVRLAHWAGFYEEIDRIVFSEAD